MDASLEVRRLSPNRRQGCLLPELLRMSQMRDEVLGFCNAKQ